MRMINGSAGTAAVCGGYPRDLAKYVKVFGKAIIPRRKHPKRIFIRPLTASKNYSNSIENIEVWKPSLYNRQELE